MGEMSEMFLGFSASDMFCRDLDAALRGRPFVSECVLDTDETDYPGNRLPLLSEISDMSDIYGPVSTPALNRHAIPNAYIPSHSHRKRKAGKTIMAKNTSPTHVITGKCRLSYAHVWEPSRMSEDDPLKYSACIIVPKSDKATVAKIQTAIEAAIQDGIKSKWRGKKPANLKLPLRDGDDERPDDAAFDGCYFLNANARRQPGIVDLARNELKKETDEDKVYSGCYCRFSLDFYPFSGKQNGVAAGLNNIQLVCDGDRLAGGSRAEDDFDDDYAATYADIEDGDVNDIF